MRIFILVGVSEDFGLFPDIIVHLETLLNGEIVLEPSKLSSSRIEAAIDDVHYIGRRITMSIACFVQKI